MKNVLCLVSVSLGMTCLCYAAEVEVLKSDRPSQVVIESKFFAGSIVDVHDPDPAQGTRFRITVASEGGQRMDFVITPGTPVAIGHGKTIAPKHLKEGDKVTVEYTTTKVGDLNRTMRIVVEEQKDGR